MVYLDTMYQRSKCLWSNVRLTLWRPSNNRCCEADNFADSKVHASNIGAYIGHMNFNLWAIAAVSTTYYSSAQIWHLLSPFRATTARRWLPVWVDTAVATFTNNPRLSGVPRLRSICLLDPTHPTEGTTRMNECGKKRIKRAARNGVETWNSERLCRIYVGSGS